MVDRDKIEGLFRHLERYVTYLRQIGEQDRQNFLRDPRSIGSARYYLQVSIETCISIANHIIASERLPSPKDYRDTFKVPEDAEILPGDLAQTMQNLAGLRNLLVHQYADVDDRLVYEGIKGELSDFAAFTRSVLAFLDRTQA